MSITDSDWERAKARAYSTEKPPEPEQQAVGWGAPKDSEHAQEHAQDHVGWGAPQTTTPAQENVGWGTPQNTEPAQEHVGWGTPHNTEPAQEHVGWGTPKDSAATQAATGWGAPAAEHWGTEWPSATPSPHELREGRAKFLGALLTMSFNRAAVAQAALLTAMSWSDRGPKPSAQSSAAPSRPPKPTPSPFDKGASKPYPLHTPNPRPTLFAPMRGRATRSELIVQTFVILITTGILWLTVRGVLAGNGDLTPQISAYIAIGAVIFADLRIFCLLVRRSHDAGRTPNLMRLFVGYHLMPPVVWIAGLSLEPQPFHNKHGNYYGPEKPAKSS